MEHFHYQGTWTLHSLKHLSGLRGTKRHCGTLWCHEGASAFFFEGKGPVKRVKPDKTMGTSNNTSLKADKTTARPKEFSVKPTETMIKAQFKTLLSLSKVFLTLSPGILGLFLFYHGFHRGFGPLLIRCTKQFWRLWESVSPITTSWCRPSPARGPEAGGRGTKRQWENQVRCKTMWKKAINDIDPFCRRELKSVFFEKMYGNLQKRFWTSKFHQSIAVWQWKRSETYIRCKCEPYNNCFLSDQCKMIKSRPASTKNISIPISRGFSCPFHDHLVEHRNSVHRGKEDLFFYFVSKAHLYS